MEKSSEYLNIVEETSAVKIGLKPEAKDDLGDVKFVDIVSSGEDLVKGDMFASVEAKKAVVELEMPFEGTIVEINKDIEDNPEKIFDKNLWLVKIKKS